MHSPKRKEKPQVTAAGLKKGRKALDEKTFTSPIYLDIKCAQWLQRQAHMRRTSRSSVMRQLIVEEMRRELAEPSLAARIVEDRMDMLAGGS